MPSSDVVETVIEFNRGRDPRRLRLKYAAMHASAFAFLRGTCHLFYADLPSDGVLRQAPLAWISGDLHLENFGAYRGDNRLVYFDLNDFDEACLAPCSWELLRILTSILLAGDLLGVSERDAAKLCRVLLDAYCAELKQGKARWLERPLAEGLIRELLQDLKRTHREKFLDKRTFLKGKHRKFRIDDERALETSEHEREQVAAELERFAVERKHADFYRVLDVADRVAGTGSLGLRRYAVLVEGRGSPDGNFLLDIKQALPSAPARHLDVPQPAWPSEAERVVTLQRNLEAIAPALLAGLEIDGRSYVLKELQPSEQRVNLAVRSVSRGKLKAFIRNMGELTAWSQLRAAGWRGSALRETLTAFAEDPSWSRELVELARERAQVLDAYWKEFCSAYADGGLE